MIGEPYSITHIAPDLTGRVGNIFASDVNAVSDSKKRKRSEIAIAIDRQGVNIYHVIRNRMFQRMQLTDVNRFAHRSLLRLMLSLLRQS